MIKRVVLLCCLLIISDITLAQFNNFEIIEGIPGDTITNGTVSVQLSENGYVSWGLHSTIGYNHVYLYEYDLTGVRIDSNAFAHPNEFVYIGTAQSFIKNLESGGYLYSAGITQSDNTTAGYLMSFSNDLDTSFTERYSPYPYTYIRGVGIFEDEYILLGDYSPNDGFVGTFMLRTNLEGEVLSNTILHEYENLANYSNSYIEKVGEKYFISGLVMDNGDQYGMLSITDLEGNLLEEIEYYDQSYDDWSPLGLAKLANGELMIVQSLGYEEYDDPLNQGFYWKNIRLAKFGPETGEEYWSQIYLDQNEIIRGRWMDIEPTEDGGVIVLGFAYSDDIFSYCWLMKIDAEGNEEWFQTYWIEEGGFAVNWLRDVEVAHDGGYIMAGTVENYDIDNFSRAWILKVDACGDTEWQDCQPLSTDEPDAKPNVVLYPNPATDMLFWDGQIERLTFYNILGKMVLQQNQTLSNQSLSISNLESGFYTVVIEKPGKSFSQKLLIER
jgi:hypothetical protein